MGYADHYKVKISDIIKSSSTYIINSPKLRPGIRLQRERPISFFRMIEEGNNFNKTLGAEKVIDLPQFDESQTYDGVHYTPHGNHVVFNEIKEYL